MIEDLVKTCNREDLLVMTFYPNYPVSTNDMYIPISKGYNTRRAYYKKSNELITYQEELFKQMTNNYSEQIVRFLDYCNSNYKSLGFRIYFLIGMHDMYYKQKSKSHDLRPYDISNYVKATEDILSNRLERNDKYNMEIHPIKYKSNEDHWRYTIIVQPVDYTLYNEELIDSLVSQIINESMKGGDSNGN